MHAWRFGGLGSQVGGNGELVAAIDMWHPLHVLDVPTSIYHQPSAAA